jgi:hypothetical protein
MLAVAARKSGELGLRNTEFLKDDISRVLDRFDDNSLDAVTCGWAIGYVNPGRLISTAARKIKTGGKMGIIENLRDTLAPIRKTALKVAQARPQHFTQLMDLHFRLPRSAGEIEQMYTAAGLTVLQGWEGEEKFRFNTGAEVLNWVLHTGASAGFDKAMNPDVKKECDDLFIRFIEEDYLKNGRIEVAHHFGAAIAKKEE